MCQGKKEEDEPPLEESMETSIKGYEYHIKKNKELITATINTSDNLKINRKNKKDTEMGRKKHSSKYFKRKTGEISN